MRVDFSSSFVVPINLEHNAAVPVQINFALRHSELFLVVESELALVRGIPVYAVDFSCVVGANHSFNPVDGVVLWSVEQAK